MIYIEHRLAADATSKNDPLNVFSQEQLRETAHKHSAHPPEEFFSRVLHDIREFSKRESFDDDVCVVGLQVQHTD